jgi:radical SAM protein with 4Fe4S-binding SPASM domain
VRPGLARLAERSTAECVPFQVLFEVTARCHLDCVHCYLPRPAPADELDLPAISRILAELRAAGTLFVTFTGGEPFLRPDLLEILAAARREHLAVRLYTAGTHIGRAEAAALARLKLVAVELSVYGGTAAAHERVTRRPGSLRRSLRAAALLRRNGVNVVLKSPALRSTGEAYLEVPALARRLGAGVRLDPAIVTARDGSAAPTAERVGVDGLARLFAAHGPAADEPLPAPPPPDTPTCALARRTARIGPEGLVYPCGAWPTPAGDLRTASFATIWREAPLLRELRSLSVGDLQGDCTGCARVGYCGRCTALALLEHGDPLGPSREACDRARARELVRDGGAGLS